LLAAMNRRLIEEERYEHRFSTAELEARMRQFLSGDYGVVVFEVDGDVVGYAVYQERRHEHPRHDSYIYVRQFFIERDRRRRGVGRAAFEGMVETCLPTGVPITLEVLETNPDGRRFWEAIGFAPYCTTMRRRGGGS
jgi:GNAT superfamily N-acetyltransferase